MLSSLDETQEGREVDRARMRLAGCHRSAGRGPGWVATLVVGAVGLGACESTPLPAPLATRVTAFWEARLQGDEVTAYQYEADARTGAVTLTQYIQARSPALTYKAYSIDNIQEQEDAAVVTINVQSQMHVPGMVDLPLDMAIEERWVRLDDRQWYRKTRPEKPGRAARRQG